MLLWLVGRLDFAMHKINRNDTFIMQYYSGRASGTGRVHFTLEVWKRDGNVFVPNTLHNICCGIMRYLRANRMSGIDILKILAFHIFGWC